MGYDYQDRDDDTGEWRLCRQHVCSYCINEDELIGSYSEPRYSFGIYAGRYCDPCWKKSGYRDATDPNAKFDPADAGERLEPEDP